MTYYLSPLLISFLVVQVTFRLPLAFFHRSSSTSQVLNITSRLGSLDKVKNPSIREILESEKLSLEEVDGVVELFLENVKNETWEKGGWPELWTDYAVSKLALNAYTRVLAKRFEGRGLSVNSFCPGFTQTSMTRGQGSHSADDAAHLGASLALLPPQDLPTGKLFLWTSNNNNNNNSSSGLNLYSKL